MKMKMFATLDKANRNTGSIRGLNLEAVKHTTVQVTAVAAGATNDRAMTCSTEPELTEALYMLYIHTFNNLYEGKSKSLCPYFFSAKILV
jgi:hypothetical protein